MGVALHPVAAGIEPTGEIHDSRAGMRRQVFPHQPVEHDGAGDDAAVHVGVLVGEGKIVVQTADDLLGLQIADRAAPAALLGPGVDGLQHGLRHAGEGDGFCHISSPPV